MDFVRGLAVFFMIFIHTLWMYADIPTQTDSLLGAVIHLPGKATAVFLYCMGISLVLSRQQGLANGLGRGHLLLLDRLTTRARGDAPAMRSAQQN